jgi:excisionase family DNA binding protein
MNELFTPKELCEYIKISKRTLYRMLSKGKLSFAIKIEGSWRFFKRDVDKYLQDSKIHYKVLNVINNCIDECVESKKGT